MVRYVAGEETAHCPFGAPGDRLWVAEPWAEHDGDLYLQALCHAMDLAWQPARTMPRHIARSWVEVVSVKLERLTDISSFDLTAEGSLWLASSADCASPRQGFARWWDSLHAREGTRWSDDPLVWVVAFHKMVG
jgi:hypothetical protein